MSLNYLIEENLHFLLTAENLADFSTAFLKAVNDMEFEYYAYGLRVSIPITKPLIRLQNNYPIKWQKNYVDKEYLLCDPTVKHGITSNIPVVWKDEFFKESMNFWEDAQSNGLKHGWAQSSHLNRSTTGMLTLARSDEYLTTKELQHKTPQLLWLNQIAQAGFQQYMLNDLHVKQVDTISNREIEVIKWSAEGKTSYEIGIILGIAERTVNFHITNVVHKLAVSNKTAAVIRSFQLGII